MLPVNRRPAGSRAVSRAGQLGVGVGAALAGVDDVTGGAGLAGGVLAGAGVRLGVVCVGLGDVLADLAGLAVREGLAGAVGAVDGGAAGAVVAGAGFPVGWTVPADTGRTRM
ncbi:MAG TPA: hypothetical protein VF838_08575 [Trebonia sp.]